MALGMLGRREERGSERPTPQEKTSAAF